MLRERAHLALAVAIAALALHCTLCKITGTISDITRSGKKGDPFTVPGYQVPPPRARSFAAGAASADLTPPPGFPTGGHGPAGDVARGYWMRLHSRAFFFEDAQGRALALISADLFAIPGGLPQRVAALATRRLASAGIEVSLPPESVVIAATHTHQGPGNFLTARVYNQFGSSWPGFDQDLFEFLAGRMADSLAGAVTNARRHLEPVEIDVHTRQVDYDFLRNRAPETFLLNRDRDAILAGLNRGVIPPACTPLSGEPKDFWDLADCPRLRAVDRALTVVEVNRITAARRRRIATLVFFAVHPTDLPAETPFYSPDVAGMAMAVLEKDGGDGEAPVAGFFNGAEGDVTLRRQRRDLRETIAMGERFAREVEETLRAPAARVSLADGVQVHGRAWRPADEGKCGEARLAPAPAFGAAALGGSEDDRTQLYMLGWRDGVRDSSAGPQGVKLPALDSRLLRGARFSTDFAPPEAYPGALPLVRATIGNFTLAAIPVEASTAEGALIRRTLRLPHGELELIGLANAYASYCSSRDEYWAQDYMGASTLWGAEEGPYLACRLAELAGGPASPSGAIPEESFLPGVAPEPPFGPGFAGKTERPDDGLERVLRDLRGRPERSLPWFGWTEPEGRPYQRTVERTVAVWRREGQGYHLLETDSGGRFLTIQLDQRRWTALWLGPLVDQPAGEFAFVVTFAGGRACSAPFSLPANGNEIEAASCDALQGGSGR